MTIFASAFALGAALIILSVVAQILRKKRRKDRFRGLELKPNCLLTRYPIAFLSGPRSVFRFLDHWNDVPLYLREHGYEVLVIEPAGRTPEERAIATAKAIEDAQTRCHLIADSSLEREMELIAAMGIGVIESMTVVKNPERKTTAVRAQDGGISIADLKPLKSAVEVFEIGSAASNLGFDSKYPSVMEIGARALLTCHNYAIRKRSPAVDAVETAELGLFRGFRNEERFLDLAVSLAERDLMGSGHR